MCAQVYCPEHFEQLFLQRCSVCSEIIKGQYLKVRTRAHAHTLSRLHARTHTHVPHAFELRQVMDTYYHPGCWKCTDCGSVGVIRAMHVSTLYTCSWCYCTCLYTRCSACSIEISAENCGQYNSNVRRSKAADAFTQRSYTPSHTQFYCKPCAVKARAKGGSANFKVGPEHELIRVSRSSRVQRRVFPRVSSP